MKYIRFKIKWLFASKEAKELMNEQYMLKVRDLLKQSRIKGYATILPMWELL
jgi:hypothetical protein